MIHIVEILEHWYAGRSRAMAEWIRVDRKTVRKDTGAAEGPGFDWGWLRAFFEWVIQDHLNVAAGTR